VVDDGVTGWIVDVGRYAEEAADRLTRLRDIDPGACRDRVRHRFSKEAMVAGYERVFDAVVGGG
jgi:glycosyltransferase involved in cell wall biosynthesis